MKGTIKTLVPDKGFGFIKGEDGKEYFFHRTALGRGVEFDSLVESEWVSFDVAQGDKGPRADAVTRG